MVNEVIRTFNVVIILFSVVIRTFNVVIILFNEVIRWSM